MSRSGNCGEFSGQVTAAMSTLQEKSLCDAKETLNNLLLVINNQSFSFIGIKEDTSVINSILTDDPKLFENMDKNLISINNILSKQSIATTDNSASVDTPVIMTKIIKQDIKKKQDTETEVVNNTVEINIDYILKLIKKYHDTQMRDKEIIIDIQKSIDSSPELRSKKDLIVNFIASLTPSSKVDSDWKKYIQAKMMIEELDELIAKENLNKEETYKFIDAAFRNGYVQEIGTAIDAVLPPTDIFAPNDDHYNKRMTVLEKIKNFFNRFKDVSNGKL